MREHICIAVRNNIHFMLYRCCCKGRSSINIYKLKYLKSQGIWPYLASGHPVDLLPVCSGYYIPLNNIIGMFDELIRQITLVLVQLRPSSSYPINKLLTWTESQWSSRSPFLILMVPLIEFWFDLIQLTEIDFIGNGKSSTAHVAAR